MLLEPDHSQPDAPLNQDPVLLAELRDKALTQFRDLWGALNEPDLEALEAQLRPDLRQRLNHIRAPLAFDFETGQKVLAPALRDRYDVNARIEALLATLDGDTRRKIQHRWHPLHASLYVGAKTLLANTIIPLNADRTEMANGLEGRPPILDHKLAELVCHLPPSAKLAYCPQGSGLESGRSAMRSYAADAAQARFREKWVLREAARPFVTAEIYARPKHGFQAPTKYLRGGPLHGLLARLLTRERVAGVGFLDWNAVERALGSGFGEDGSAVAFASCVLAAGYVVIGERFGVARAVVA